MSPKSSCPLCWVNATPSSRPFLSYSTLNVAVWSQTRHEAAFRAPSFAEAVKPVDVADITVDRHYRLDFGYHWQYRLCLLNKSNLTLIFLGYMASHGKVVSSPRTILVLVFHLFFLLE
jgi:hypothetical protein